MISRRLLRLKVMQMIYSHLQKMSGDINQTEKELFESIHKTYELYHNLLLLLIELKYYAQQKLEINRNKFIKPKDPKDLSENFVNNKMIALLEENYLLQTFLNNYKFNWNEYPETIASLYQEIYATDFFTNYLLIQNPEFSDDKKVVLEILSEIFPNSRDLNQTLEEASIFWNDDLEFVISNCIETLKKFKPELGKDNKLMKMYKSEEDVDFTKNLLRKTIIHHNDHIHIIEQYLENWEVERIAQLDIILLELALTELYYMEEVPTRVTLNEYIEISKYYSTDKSSTFINGILDKIVQEGKKSGKIVKKGKGLIGEIN